MNLDFQQILLRPGLLTNEMPPNRSGMIAISGTNPDADKLASRNDSVTTCERNAFVNFGGWISRNPVKPGQTQSNLIQPNPTKKIAWISPAWFKAGMAAYNS
jgi:hypothetical protein